MSIKADAGRLKAALSICYPDLFDLENPKPRRIGIFEDILTRFPDAPTGVCALAISWWTIRRAYLRACTANALRFGFDGPDGTVTDQQAKWATATLKRREANEAAKTNRRLAA